MFAVLYKVSSQMPQAHIFQVHMTLPNVPTEGLSLSLPDWIPGSYMIRDFSKHLFNLQAYDQQGQRVALIQKTKSEWCCEYVEGQLTITYEVYAWDLSVRGSHLDQTHGFFNGTSLFLRASAYAHLPHAVDILPPTGIEGWQVATTLKRAETTPEWSFGHYYADDYDELIDHPVEMGTFEKASFIIDDIPHHIVITGRHRADLTQLTKDLTKICQQQIQFFGSAPFSSYLFLVTAVESGYGGLEHRSSTALICSRDDLPIKGQSHEPPADGYRTFLGLCSHEYFHSWNIKQIKPKAFYPYQLQQENYTTLLWLFEGFTSYYDDVMLWRAGIISEQAYWQLVAKNITRHLRTPGRHQQTLADSSFNAWTKYYQQNENTNNIVVSYYVKGALLALCLDLLIQQQSNGRYSLDDIMLRLWHDFALKQQGVTEDAMSILLKEYGGESALSLLNQGLYSLEELPYKALLGKKGLQVYIRPANNELDIGGSLQTVRPIKKRLYTGVKWQSAEGGVLIQSIMPNSPAQKAGLSAHDIIFAINGLRVKSGNFDKLIQACHEEGSSVTCHFFRRDEMMIGVLELLFLDDDSCDIILPP